jgi:hypothetical protein
MKPAATRLALTIALFLGWLSYLGYLVVCRPHAPNGLRGAFEGRSLTLSRPQFLVSMIDVVAEVNDASGENVIIQEVLFPREKPPLTKGEKIHVENIDHCHPVPDPMARDSEPPHDYTGPGSYILPLHVIEKNGERRFQVVPTPPSPGFQPQQGSNVGPPRIYPATPELLAEYREIAKPRS